MRIGIITSGGDSPGMNPCIADLALQGHARGHEMFTFSRGFCGIYENKIQSIYPNQAYGLHRRGGSVIKADRLPSLIQPDVQSHVAKVLSDNGIQSVIVLGGDGSFRGANALSQIDDETNYIGIPCTIDNNIYGSDYSLGFDTALNKLVNYIDDITDTAESMYPRVFFIETLGGSDHYFVKLPVLMGISDFCLIPKQIISPEGVTGRIKEILDRHDKNYVIVTVAEAMELIPKILDDVKRSLGISVKYNMIGYQQRGGAPTALERIHAAQFATKALDAIENSVKNVYIAHCAGQYIYQSLDLSIREKHTELHI